MIEFDLFNNHILLLIARGTIPFLLKWVDKRVAPSYV